MSEYRQLVKIKEAWKAWLYYVVLHKLRVTTWVFSLLVDVNVYIEPIRRGCSVFYKNVDYSNMSTKVLSKTYIRSYRGHKIVAEVTS